MNKSLLWSRTFWFNILAILVELTSIVEFHDVLSPKAYAIMMVIHSGANILLRLCTNTGINGIVKSNDA